MNKRRNTTPTFRPRIMVLALLLLSLFGSASVCAVRLQLFPDESLSKLAERQHNLTVKIPPERGEILDRNYQVLAKSVQGYTVCTTSSKALQDRLKFNEICEVLGLNANDVAKRVAKRGGGATQLKRRLTPAEVAALRELDSPFITIDAQPTRYYPKNAIAGQVIGSVRDGVQPLGGLENKFDSLLKGRPLTVRAKRIGDRVSMLDEAPRVEETKGSSLVLTLDVNIQHIVEEELERAVTEYKAEGASAVVMDPATGEILALAHVPRVNSNLYSSAQMEERSIKTVSNVYEPGSTMKSILLSILLEDGAAKPGDTVYCERGNWPVHGHVIHDHHGYGTLTIEKVLEVSSNIGVAKLSQSLSPQEFYDGLRKFGFGEKTGVELPAESPGILLETKDWNLMTPLTVAYGQGISVTPLQLTSALAALANGGVRMKPHIIKEVLGSDGAVLKRNEPEVLGQAVSPKTAKTILKWMEAVVYGEDGTASKAAVPGYTVAGKTGTAWQPDPKTRTYDKRNVVASFMGVAPAKDPKYVALFAVERPDISIGEYGGAIAGPVFSEVFKKVLPEEGVKPDRLKKSADSTRVARSKSRKAPALYPKGLIASGEMPDLEGLPMREALRRIEKAGVPVEVEITGSGYLIRQSPGAGQSLTEETIVRLEFIDAI
ncbi:MAG: hypothetical protein C0609_00565 [Deltaproteobacteria bacterium]|nr:MAG: hypothetical protein C0609_00565 [Deltaproteobacteria bacterium]